MKLLRQVLAFCLVFSLAATPVAARLAVASGAISKANAVNAIAMPDCHGMKMLTPEQKQPAHKTCPGCDKSNSCSANACELQCFKIIAALPDFARSPVKPLPLFVPALQVASAPIDLAPPAPPPRA